MTRGQLDYRLKQGHWTRLAESVYAVATSAPSWERQLQAALLGRPGSLAAGRSAGVLLGFSGFRRTRPEILVPFEGPGRSPLARTIRSRHFEQVKRTRIAGFLVTAVAETVLTLSLKEPAATIERVIDDRLAAGAVDIADFFPILDRLEYARQPGLAHLRRAVSHRSVDAYQPPTTVLEHLLYQLLGRPEIPSHERQLPISYERVDATVDAFIPEWSLIVEGDGRRWHTRKADFERDRRRDNAAAAAGLLVIRFTYRMLKTSPDDCLATLVNTGKWRQPA